MANLQKRHICRDVVSAKMSYPHREHIHMVEPQRHRLRNVKPKRQHICKDGTSAGTLSPQRRHIPTTTAHLCKDLISAKTAHLHKEPISGTTAHLCKDVISANVDLHSIGTMVGLLAGIPWE
jgi:hypothetical protein